MAHNSTTRPRSSHLRARNPLFPSSQQSGQSESEMRSRMRQDYLRYWIVIATKKPEATFHMYKNTSVTGRLEGIDATQSYCNVSDLKTPIGTYKEATLRVNDCQQVVFDL
ncbi:hypothetical protein HDU79_006682 [Rhizoclosmatium sp. JEL0117]|nr:hypothetical protein HDU79_006682 [Rhizoclosmatium sp. JEL0117]